MVQKYLHDSQGRRKHLKLGGAQHFEGTFFLRKWVFSKNKKGTSLCMASGSYVHDSVIHKCTKI